MLGAQVIGIRGAGFDSITSVIAGGAEALDRVQRYLQTPPGREVPDMIDVSFLAPIPTRA